MKAVENSGTVIGLKGKDGVVLAAEKIIMSKLHEPGSNRRIFNVDKHIGMVIQQIVNFIHFISIYETYRRCLV